MPYTAAQLNAYYTSLTGTAPMGADAVLINAYAAQSQGGTLSDTNTLLGVFNSAGVQASFEVAESTYQFFTGSGVTQAGLAFLEGTTGSGNASGLNSTYFSQFNTENRYYNFAINLASAGGAGNAMFVSNYGTLTFAQTVAAAYETIVGSANVGTAAANAAIAAITADQAYFTSIAQQRAGGIDAGGAAGQNIALKAIAVGYILEEANKADVGTYAKAIDQLEAAVAANATVGGVNSPFGTNILTTFGPSGSGFNTGFTALGTSATAQTNFTLTTGIDAPALGTGNVQYIGTVNVNGNNSNVVNPSTLQAGDQIKATGANNTLTVTTIGGTAAAPIDATGGAVISGVQTIDVRAVADPVSGNAGGATFNAQGNTAGNGQGNVSGTTALYAYLSNAAITFNNVSTQAVGIVNDGITTGAALTANYVTSATSAVVNLAGGTTAGETAALAGTGLVTVNVNSNGGLNTLTTLTLPTGVTTVNLAATSALTLTGGLMDTGLTTLTASGSNPINVGTINATNLTSLNTTGLTSTGALTATILNAPTTTANYQLGAGADILTFGTAAAPVTLTNATINLGGGANALTVTGGITGTTIIGGAQADVVTVVGAVDGTSVINTGGGGDTIRVDTTIGGAATTAAGATLNGGGGALLVTDAANFASIDTFSAANLALITGFTTVAVDDRLGATSGTTYDINAVGAANFTTVGVAAGNTANLNANTGTTVTFAGNVAGFGGGTLANNTGTLNISLANAATNANDILNLGYTAQPAGTVTSNVNVTGAAGAGVETINVATNGTVTNATNIRLNLVDAALTNISFAGNESITYAPVAAHTVLTSINGAADTGTLVVDITALSSTGTSPVTVTTGVGNDIVFVKDFAQITTGGVSGAAGFNTVTVATTTSGQTYSTVLDAKAGDHINFGAGSGAAGTTSTSVNLTKVVLNSGTAVFQDYLDAATGANTTTGEISAFDFAGNTYVVENNNAALTFQDGSDSVIKLVGIHSISTTSTAGTLILGS